MKEGTFMIVLVVNCGSSSLKYQLVNMDNEEVMAKGLVEKITLPDAQLTHKWGDQKKEVVQPIPDHKVAVKLVLDILTDPEVGVIKSMDEIDAVGHRVVHGGEEFAASTLITDEVMKALEKCSAFAPLHNPPNIVGIKACEAIMPNVPQVAVFDTSFHQTLPEKAFRYAIPNHFYTEDQVRVYGFHGISHKYVDGRTRRYFNNPHLKNITIHLGNGASMAAVNEQGHSIDTSMGFGPNEGLMMGTRSGDIDSAAIFYLADKGHSLSEINNILNKESGMKGISGSSDARDVEALFDKNDTNGILCFDMYAYRIQKYIGAYAAALNGVDTLIFTAGIGENSPLVRSLVCKNLEFFGIKIDETKNEELSRPDDIVEIQTADSKVKIVIVATNEELQIARDILALI